MGNCHDALGFQLLQSEPRLGVGVSAREPWVWDPSKFRHNRIVKIQMNWKVLSPTIVGTVT